MTEYLLDEAYTVLEDGQTFCPLTGSKIIFASAPEGDDEWHSARDAKPYREIDIRDLLEWALVNGFKAPK
jgi:hypothetical protein